MDHFMERQPDPLDDLLRSPALPADGEALRDRLREQTTRLLRRRRRLRRLARTAALAACFLGGLLTMHWVRPVGPGPVPPPVTSKVKPAPREAEPEAVVPPTAVAVEWRALEGEGNGRELYREAGDRYLSEDNDVAAAVRCYGNALDAGTERDLAVAGEDSWLLMTIKDARQKEKRHAKSGG